MLHFMMKNGESQFMMTSMQTWTLLKLTSLYMHVALFVKRTVYVSSNNVLWTANLQEVVWVAGALRFISWAYMASHFEQEIYI